MAKFDELSALLEGFVKEGLPGCGCAVAKDGKTLFEGYYGYADIESQKPITEDTVYRLFSMTKVIVCTAAMMLFEKGRFLLNEPLYEYFPTYKDSQVVVKGPNGEFYTRKAKSPILVKHAFMMAVGLPYPEFTNTPTAQHMKKIREELTKKYGKYDVVTEASAMGEVPLEFDPGTQWLYGYGHDIVGALVQLVSGKKLGQFLKDEIFDPLGMKDTGYRFRDDIESRMVSFYNKDENKGLIKMDGALDSFHHPDALYEAGGFGLYSTVKDYLKFSQMLANGGCYNGQRIIGRKTIDLMRTNQLNQQQLEYFRNPYLDGYGYGLGVRTMMEPGLGSSNVSVGEFGWTGFAGTYVSIDPKENFSIVYMHQQNPNNEYYYHHRVRNVAYGCIE